MKPDSVQKRLRLRTILIGVLFSAVLAGIGAKAAYLQIFQHSWLSKKAVGQVTASLDQQAKRGAIFDAGLQEMAVSVDVHSVAAYPGRIADPAGAARALASVLSTSPGQLDRKLRMERPFVWIKRQADPKEAQAVEALAISGIDFVPEHKRFYPNTVLAAQVIGFAGVDGTGLEGLEYYYNNELAGRSSQTTILRDALGRGFEKAEGFSGTRSGNNLVLTLQRGVQFLAEDALAAAVAEFTAESGIAVVLSAKTGAVLALAHYPFFNPNAFVEFDRGAWRNRSITDPYEPGSTLKIFTAAAALETGAMTPDSVVYCENGQYRVGGNVIHDIKPHEWLSLADVLRVSSNIGAAKIGDLVGARELHRTLQRFGFGRRTGIDCPGESPGSLLPWQKWSKIDQCAVSFGQGVSVTALQLAAATAAIANGGVLMRPYIVQAVTDKNGRLIHRTEPKPVGRAVSEDTAAQLRRMMSQVVAEDGSGALAVMEGYSAAGKTGTAQKVDSGGSYAKDRYVASFVGFAPLEDPEIVVLVTIDEPQKSHYGGVVAAPAFKKIAEGALHYLNIPPGGGKGRLRVSAGHKVTG
ncbi:MAG: penicillin-binding protein 2 [Desulfobacterales bacterium]|nr:penicillin-binding protein 2 [Desulfobacterales bacterium]